MRKTRFFAAGLAALLTAGVLVSAALACGHHGRRAVTGRTVSCQVCTAAGCELTGRHVHNGVTYCGYGHASGLCDGNCPDLSIYDYMMYIASIKGIRQRTANKRTKQLLGQVGLAKYEKRKMKTLSGGMLRRAGIAQAMLNNPKILVLDEPTAGLDPNERIRFRNLISELSEDRLVLLSTHIVSDVEFIANQIMLMKNGRFFYTGTTENLISSMDESVWHCTVPKQRVNDFSKKYLVDNMKTVPGGAELRILSKVPPTERAVREEATLEDAFLLYFGEKAGDKDDTEI